MKKILIFLAACLLLPLASCRDNRAESISELHLDNAADSLLYYYVQLRAYQYWQHAVNDTSMRSRMSRDEFLHGVEDGFNAYLRNDTMYNEGRRAGFRLAETIGRMEKKYGRKLDRKIVLPSFRYGLRDSADIPALEYQQEFYRLRGEIMAQQRVDKRQEARNALASEAKTHHLKKVNDDLYYLVTHPGHGPYASRGDVVYVDVDYTRTNGDDLGMPSPERVEVGSEGMPEVMTLSYEKLNKGASGVFMTSAGALFGDRASIIGLDTDAPVIITITLTDIIPPVGEESKEVKR